ncbi:hypothetical protein K438DRAFT_1975200 [Mycena galopus ATCC 62051]|nr:hypothetical protein K438DRAFT_1975200 [Mycena galopus ATCC 62051]
MSRVARGFTRGQIREQELARGSRWSRSHHPQLSGRVNMTVSIHCRAGGNTGLVAVAVM